MDRRKRQLLDHHVAIAQSRHQPVHRLLGATDDLRLRREVQRDDDVAGITEKRFQDRLGGADKRQASGPGETVVNSQIGPQPGHDLLEVDHAGAAQGGDVAETLPARHRERDAERLEDQPAHPVAHQHAHGCQAPLIGSQRRAGGIDTGQRRLRAEAAAQPHALRLRQMDRGNQEVAGGQRVLRVVVPRLDLVEDAAHPRQVQAKLHQVFRVMADQPGESLSRKQGHHLAGRRGGVGAPEQPLGLAPGQLPALGRRRQADQPCRDILIVLRDDGEAARVRCVEPIEEREGDVLEPVGLAVAFQEGGDEPQGAGHLRRCCSREGEQFGRPLPARPGGASAQLHHRRCPPPVARGTAGWCRLHRDTGGDRAGRLRLLKDHVGVDPAEAEGVDAGPARRLLPIVDPRTGQRVDEEAGRLQRRVGRSAVQTRGQNPVAERQRRLDQRGDAGGGHRVADHRFHGAEGAGRMGPAPSAVEGGDGLDLRGIALDRAGAVGLEQADGVRLEAGVGVGVLERRHLAAGGGRQEAGGAAVAGAAHSLDDRIDAVAIPEGVLGPLQHHRAGSLADQHAVGPAVERRDATGG